MIKKKKKSKNQKQLHILFLVKVYILKKKVANSLRMGTAEVLRYFQTPVCQSFWRQQQIWNPGDKALKTLSALRGTSHSPGDCSE